MGSSTNINNSYGPPPATLKTVFQPGTKHSTDIIALPSDANSEAFLSSPMPYSPRSLHEHIGDDWYDFLPPTSFKSFNLALYLMALAPWFRELVLCTKAIPARKQSNRLSTKK